MRPIDRVKERGAKFAAASTAVFASPYLVRAQEQASKIGVAPPRSARDRLQIDHISDEMRAVVESEWPELAHKLPPQKPQG